MRITNMMMTNSMLTRINNNMSSLDNYYTQLSSGKKIQMPSEDPILASRALKLRNIVSSTTQYNSNANQAVSWMETTESAFSNVTSILTSMSELCVQGASDQYKEDDRKKIINQFNSSVSQLETELNSTYMGRYIFSGYKTNEPPIVKDDTTGKNILNSKVYEPVDYSKLLDVVTGEDGVLTKTNDITSQIAGLNAQISAGGSTSDLEAQRDELIEKLKETVSADGMELVVSYDKQTISLRTIMPDDSPSSGSSGGSTSSGGSSSSGGSGTVFISFNLVDGSTSNPISAEVNSDEDGLNFKTDDNYSLNLKIPEEEYNQAISSDDIKLEVGVNNYITINSTAPEVYTTEMYEELHYFEKVYDYMSGTLSEEDINTYFGGKAYSDLTPSEVTSFDSSLRTRLESTIAKVNEYNSEITEQQANLGVRMNRTYLIQDRLGDDKVNYTNLLSKNEDINYAEVAMNFNTANATYQASLKTGMTITQLTLADYL